MSLKVVPALLFLLVLFSGPVLAENGSITITRVDNESLQVVDNDIGDAVDFQIGNFQVLWAEDFVIDVRNRPIFALCGYDYLTISNKTNLEIVDLIQCQYATRKLELAEIKRQEEQATIDLANRTHVNTYDWVKA